MEAIARLETFFAARATRAGILARGLLGKSRPDDGQLAQLLCNERRARTRMDGSLGGSLVATAWAAWEMMDLGLDELHGGLSRLLTWVVTHLEGPLREPEPSPLILPNGTTLADPADAAFAAECLGLRVVLRARYDGRPGVVQQLARVLDGWTTRRDELAASALSVVALAPPEFRDGLDAGVQRLARSQQPDGTWGNANLFHMLEALWLAGVRPARAVLARAAPELLRRQRPDGSFDAPPQEERTLIGLRALLVTLEDDPARGDQPRLP
jgi:hypothetical protein